MTVTLVLRTDSRFARVVTRAVFVHTALPLWTHPTLADVSCPTLLLVRAPSYPLPTDLQVGIAELIFKAVYVMGARPSWITGAIVAVETIVTVTITTFNLKKYILKFFLNLGIRNFSNEKNTFSFYQPFLSGMAFDLSANWRGNG